MITDEMPEEMLDAPEGVGAYEFDKYCNTWGGSSFRSGVSLYRHHGMFVGYDHYDRWIVRFSSDPNAEWVRGCQDSTYIGDCYPQSKTARLICWSELPVPARRLALQWYREAIANIRQLIQRGRQRTAELEAAQAKRRQEYYEKTVVQPWLEAVATSASLSNETHRRDTDADTA